MSEDLAPFVLLRDELVPASYRAELDRLRAHLGQRVMVRGAQLSEEKPAWTNALGPVPGRDVKAAEWHRIAAETEAYRNRYHIGTHETAFIPKQYRDDPAAQRLIARATALHKHSALTQVPPRSTAQVQQAADEAAITDRMTTNQAAARRAIERLQAERAAASDPLPAPQQREARIVDAVQAEPVQQQSDEMSAAVARAIARHRAATTTTGSEPTPGVQDQSKESSVSQEKTSTRTGSNPSGVSATQAEVIRRRREASARTTSRKPAQDDTATASRRAQDAQSRDQGRSL